MDEDNLALALYSAVVKASKGTRREGFVDGAVTYQRDLINKRITGNFIIPLEEVVNDESGEVIHRIADFLASENTGDATP